MPKGSDRATLYETYATSSYNRYLEINPGGDDVDHVLDYD